MFPATRSWTECVEADNEDTARVKADGMGEWEDDADGCTPVEVEEIIEAK